MKEIKQALEQLKSWYNAHIIEMDKGTMMGGPHGDRNFHFDYSEGPSFARLFKIYVSKTAGNDRTCSGWIALKDGPDYRTGDIFRGGWKKRDAGKPRANLFDLLQDPARMEIIFTPHGVCYAGTTQNEWDYYREQRRRGIGSYSSDYTQFSQYAEVKPQYEHLVKPIVTPEGATQ